MLKRSYQTLLIAMSMLLVVLNFVFPLTKASAEVINRERYEMKWSYSPMYGKELRTELLKNTNGQIAYCLTYGKLSPNGNDLPEMGRTDNIVYRVLLNGYPQKSPEELGVSNWQEAHYATQISVWSALGQIDINDVQHKNANVAKAVKAIIAGADASQETQELYMNVTPTDSQEAKLNGEYFETTNYQVESNAKNGVFTVQLTNAPTGTKVVSTNGEEKQQFNLGEQFRILVPKASPSGTFSLKVSSNLSKLHAVAYKGNDKIQDATVLLERTEEKVSTDLQVHWKSLGGLKVVKVGEQKEVLQGAVFEVFNSANEKVGTITTNEEGTASLSGLEAGKYSLKEVKAPTGYVLNDQPKILEVKTSEVATITVENTKIKGNVQLLKVDQDGKKKLAGAVFVLVDEKGNQLHEYTTDKDGLIKVNNLPFGKYQFIEKSSPTGYILTKDPIPFNITENGKTIELIAKNTQAKGSLEITKVDVADGNNKLPGAEFTIYNEKGEEVVKGKTNEQGIAKFEKLPAGKYTYKETFAPEGYVVNEETFSFEIKADGEIIKHIVKDKKIEGILEITKVDVADGNNKLPGAEFTIYNEKGKEVVKGKTNKEGIAKFEKLPAGKYTYKETFAPEGYLINEETFSFEIKKDGEIIKHTVKDQKKPTPSTPETPQTPEQPETPQPQTPEQPKVTEKPVTPQPEKPQQIVTKPQLEQTPKKVEKVDANLPTTGGKAENPYIKWIGIVCVVLGAIGAVFAVRNRKKAQ
ncbi:Cys-Gln thioester bond-forming surface protein [Bacillus sp. Xin]|uniref:SpaA isopeptide-forming pilin-related protein n=1 Tax=unclassified Bacillus (in: firmicutes) TaxID=185979 RepID=UPI00157168D7|nr:MULTISPECIES: SpaA isopeptide-forming pilin-related protein [unclassified Bacillus (in: firmicutes)]MBC6971861.1 Cys-Gln thioester bond-forming surface protein [Bacillus sp. Xin]NSW39324.1 Cys-Gln thioester bond-forming surface protein [Bacillus sp. Xin1]